MCSSVPGHQGCRRLYRYESEAFFLQNHAVFAGAADKRWWVRVCVWYEQRIARCLQTVVFVWRCVANAMWALLAAGASLPQEAGQLEMYLATKGSCAKLGSLVELQLWRANRCDSAGPGFWLPIFWVLWPGARSSRAGLLRARGQLGVHTSLSWHELTRFQKQAKASRLSLTHGSTRLELPSTELQVM